MPSRTLLQGKGLKITSLTVVSALLPSHIQELAQLYHIFTIKGNIYSNRSAMFRSLYFVEQTLQNTQTHHLIYLYESAFPLMTCCGITKYTIF